MTPAANMRQKALDSLRSRQRRPSSSSESGDGSRDRAREFAHGVQRHVFLLDAVLRRYLKRRLADLPPGLHDLLRCGVYELLFRDHVPRSVVVDSWVRLVSGPPARRGLTNAVLRRIATDARVEHATEIPVARDRVITEPGRIIAFPLPILPDPAKGRAQHRSLHFTLPLHFVEVVQTLVPDAQVDALLLALGTPLPLSLRPCPGTTLAALADALTAAGATEVRVLEGVVTARWEGSVADLPPLRDGLAVVQDLVPARVAPTVDPAPGDRILDLCAGQGGKSIHLAQLLAGTGEVVAADVDPRRLARLQETASRLGLTNVSVFDLGPESSTLPAGLFDRVLVDAPCSNSGVLMKRVEARFRLIPEAIRSLTKLQAELLVRGAQAVRPGGRLVYATCSILPEENDRILDQFLASHPDFRVLSRRLHLPTETGRDGGFVAALERADPA